jgi:hypothetical protein
MVQILAVIIGFLLTGIIGNQLVQRWQHRTWLHQQRFLGAEKEFVALRDLATELSAAISARLYKMRRLLWAVCGQDDEKLAQRLSEYDLALVNWNESLTSFYVRLAFCTHYYDSTSLERLIHEPFQQAGADLERLVRHRRNGTKVSAKQRSDLERTFNQLQAASWEFSRDLMRAVEQKREDVYEGEHVGFHRYTMDRFSTWELIKALFVREIDSFSVRRTSSDLR